MPWRFGPAAGFGPPNRMREVFQRELGLSPRAYREKVIGEASRILYGKPFGPELGIGHVLGNVSCGEHNLAKPDKLCYDLKN